MSSMFNLSQTLFPSRENPTTSVLRVGMEEGTSEDGRGEGKAWPPERVSVGKREIGRIRRTIRYCTDEDP